MTLARRRLIRAALAGIIVMLSVVWIARILHKQEAGSKLVNAIESDSYDETISALADGADPNSRCFGKDRHTSLLRRLLALVSGTSDSRSEPALCRSLRFRGSYTPNTAIALALLDRGADPNAVGEEGATALMLALKTFPVNRLLVQAFLSHGADVRAEDAHRNTPLSYALADADAVVLLLDRGASVDQPNDRGRTPLMGARTVEVAELLVAHGAKVNARDVFGRTVLSVQMGANWRGAKLFNYLVAHGAR